MNTVSTQVSPSRAERVRVCLKKTNSPNPCNRLSREALACWYRRHACALFLEFPAGGPSNPLFQHSPPVKQRFFLGSCPGSLVPCKCCCMLESCYGPRNCPCKCWCSVLCSEHNVLHLLFAVLPAVKRPISPYCSVDPQQPICIAPLSCNAACRTPFY